MAKNSAISTLMTTTMLLLLILNPAQSLLDAPVTGLLPVSTDPLLNVNLNVCAIDGVGKFRTLICADVLNLVTLQAYITTNFQHCFPDGLVIGNPYGCNLKFTTFDAVKAFISANVDAQIGLLKTSGVDLVEVCAAGKLAAEVLTLSLTLKLDTYDPNFCSSPVALSALVVVSGKCQGLSLGQILSLANSCLAGGSLPDGFVLADVLQCVVDINANFHAALVNNGICGVPSLLAIQLGIAC